MKNKKTVIIAICAVLLIVSVVSIVKFFPWPHESYSYAIQNMNIDQMTDSAALIVIGTPTGKSETIKADEDVTFILTEIKIESVIKGNKKTGDCFTVLETEGVAIDIALQKESSYLLFTKPYIPGVKEAAGNYVITQANQGIYRIDDQKNVYEYNLEGKEQLTGRRTDEIKQKFQKELAAYIVK